MKNIKTILAILVLALVTTANSYAFGNWGKNRHYVSAGIFTNETPLNCYDAVSGDPVTVKQITTADGPRYQRAAKTGEFFSGTGWQRLFPELGYGDNAKDLTKLQSGTYYFDVETGQSSIYLLAKSLDDDKLDFVLEVVEW